MTAVTVAERGPGSKSESSPNIWPGPRIASRFSRPSEEVRPSFTLPSSDDVELVAGVALVEQHLAAAQPGLGHRGAQRRGRLVVERAEQRRLTEYVVVHGFLLQ